MKRRFLQAIVIAAFILTGGWLMMSGTSSSLYFESSQNKKKTKAEKDAYLRERSQYEFDLLKDPQTGKIPYNIRERELAIARTMPEKNNARLSGIQSIENLNTYTAAGPNNIGGRTRGLAYDKRFNNTTNRVILSGSVSGGILRSADGGTTWTRVSPENDIHNVTTIAQDPRVGSENTWYAGGGEAIANSAGAAGAPFLSHGVWKSTDNGVTWTKLPLIVTDINGTILGTGALEVFDNPFDFVHKIIVHPLNGHVYVAGHRRLIRSTNGGTTWNVVFSGRSPASSDNGQIDITCTNSGKLYLAVNGGFPNVEQRGVWISATGNANNWTRIAGGQTLGVDSVAGWRGNNYVIDEINDTPIPPDTTYFSRRILVTLAPSDNNIVYVAYENGLEQDGSNPQPEADMFKLDVSSGSNVWTNLSANMPDFPNQLDGVDPLELQEGYNFMLVVKPDDPNVVFLGGVNLYRSTNGFSNTSGTSWIGGYANTLPTLKVYGSTTNPTDPKKWSHADMHNLVFEPSNLNRAICANDGGLQITENIMGTTAGTEPVSWTMMPNYQTLQYYHVAIDPASGQNNFIGGAQDNGTHLRIEDSDPNDHPRILSGDGGAAAIASITSNTFTLYGSSQFGTIYRDKTNNFDPIRPNGLTQFPGLSDAFGEFVTYFKLDFDNQEDLYYVNFNRLFRTKNASTVTSSSWEELTGVRIAVNPANPASGTNIAIRALELSRGTYFPSHALYIGTSNGRVFRLDDPRNATVSTSPVNITPVGLTGSVSDIAVNPNNDEEIMLVVSNYNTVSIWWTNNAKSAAPTWKNAEGTLTLPSMRSCMIVVKKDAANNPTTEYYVGTSVGLYSAINIGPTLQNNATVNWVREGGSILNFALMNSLDYRPQDNILLVGTHGNGMYFASTGTPDFRPNQNTGVNDPVRNDKRFIERAFPSMVKNRIEYQIGNMFTVKRIIIKINNLAGQLVLQKETAYQGGELYIRHLAKGAYVLTITSSDYKQQFVQKFVKD